MESLLKELVELARAVFAGLAILAFMVGYLWIAGGCWIKDKR